MNASFCRVPDAMVFANTALETCDPQKWNPGEKGPRLISDLAIRETSNPQRGIE